MGADLKNVRISKEATEICDEIFDSGMFEDHVSVCKFGLAYALKNYKDELQDPEALDGNYDATGYNYNIGTIDGDNYLSQLIKSLYPETSAPYRIVRVLMCFGLEKLGELNKEGKLFPINNIL